MTITVPNRLITQRKSRASSRHARRGKPRSRGEFFKNMIVKPVIGVVLLAVVGDLLAQGTVKDIRLELSAFTENIKLANEEFSATKKELNDLISARRNASEALGVAFREQKYLNTQADLQKYDAAIDHWNQNVFRLEQDIVKKADCGTRQSHLREIGPVDFDRIINVEYPDQYAAFIEITKIRRGRLDALKLRLGIDPSKPFGDSVIDKSIIEEFANPYAFCPTYFLTKIFDPERKTGFRPKYKSVRDAFRFVSVDIFNNRKNGYFKCAVNRNRLIDAGIGDCKSAFKSNSMAACVRNVLAKSDLKTFCELLEDHESRLITIDQHRFDNIDYRWFLGHKMFETFRTSHVVGECERKKPFWPNAFAWLWRNTIGGIWQIGLGWKWPAPEFWDCEAGVAGVLKKT